MKLKTILSIANQPNLNGRIYSEEVLLDIKKSFDKNKPLYGEIGFSEESITSFKSASHKINSLKLSNKRLPRKLKKELKKQGVYKNWVYSKKNNILFAEIEILKTPSGEIARKMIDNDLGVIRPRGFGNIGINGNVENYSLISFDIIDKNEDSFKNLI